MMSITMKEHRRSERHEVAFRLVFDDGETYYSAHVDDISEGGLFLQSPKPLPIGATIALAPVPEEEDPLFSVQARVVRCEDMDARTEIDGQAHFGLSGIAVEFIALDEDARRQVREMIETLEAQARARIENGVYDPYLGEYVRVPDPEPVEAAGAELIANEIASAGDEAADAKP